MNRESSSVLDLLRQAVEAAVGGERTGSDLGGPRALSDGSGADGGGGENSPAGLSLSRVALTAGLAGGVAAKPAWADMVSKVNPIAGLLAGLFSGKSEASASAAAIPVAAYLRPESMRLEAGFDGANNPAITSVERQEGGQFRPAARSNGGAQAGAQVVVQVQAMDSRSFIDHAPEIAEAVKRALLESSGLRDVLGEY